MNTLTKFFLGSVVLCVMMVGISVMYGLGIRSKLNSMEKNIVYQFEQNKNGYDGMWKTFREAAQVNEMYASDVERVFKTAIEARYANAGNNLFSMIKEQNPNFDSSMYKRLQEIIEGGRANFKEHQDKLLDKKRIYDTYINEFPVNIVAGVFGYPKINLDDYKIVTSDKTDGAFKSGKDDEIKLR